MSDRILGDYIQDILDAIVDAREFTSGMKLEGFIKDKKTINAVVRSLEVIGEAAKKIPDDMREEYPEIPWKRMAGMRDKLIHAYFGVDLEIVWEVVQSELPPIEPLVQRVLDDIGTEV